uniref:Zinc finger, CCHC-type n=1 Tax=Tanacetum cinerariifolium TaxID=118510 RepID=A0A6L2K8J0_TANCI|nr:zinc finger, CCHC-type [Tanacetum cinerariifolium]
MTLKNKSRLFLASRPYTRVLANNDEMDSIMGNNTWVLADVHPGCKPLGCKWIFKRKLKVDGTIKKFKARLVIQGFRQKSWIDYFDTYAPVTRISTIRLLITITSIHNLIIHQMDVNTSFLNGEMEEEVYMNQPKGFIMPGNENKIIKKFNYFDCTQVSTPIDTSKKMMPNNGQTVSQLEYSRVIGCLMYAMTCTRPDIAFAVGYTDASWISNTEDNPSTSGWLLVKKLNGNLVLKISLWSNHIAPIFIHCDSAATLAKAYSQMYNEKSRHLGVRHSIIRELIMNDVESRIDDDGVLDVLSLVQVLLWTTKFEKMSRDVLTVGSTMRIPLLYRGEYSQWVERFMNYLEEQTDGEAMINLIKNGDQPLPRVTQVSIAGTSSTEQPLLKDKFVWSDQEKKIQKIDRLARSLLIQGLPNDIYSLINSNKTAKDLWDALPRHMLGSEYGEQDRKVMVLYEYETFKATEGELLLDTYIRYLQVINDLKKCGYSKDNCKLHFKFLNNLQPEWKQYATMMRQNKNLIDINIDALYNILKQNQGDVNDAMGLKKKTVVVTSDPLALIAEKIKVSKRKEKVVVSSNSKGSDADDFSELNKITALLAKDFNRRKFYSKPTNNNLRTSSTS